MKTTKNAAREKEEIVFPLGGIGTGSIGISGKGVLCDWEIFGRPNKGSYNKYSHFALAAEVDGKRYVKVLAGGQTRELNGRLGNNYGLGVVQSTMSGFPHFRRVDFKGRFPFARLGFSDENFPTEPELVAFNPFIPLDADDSGLPAAMFELKLKGLADRPVKYTAALSVSNPFPRTKNELIRGQGYTGVKLCNAAVTDPDAVDYGDITVATQTSEGAGAQEYWFRGRWRDNITTFFNELTAGKFTDRHYDEARDTEPRDNSGNGADACSVYRTVELAPGEETTVRFLITWSVPNAYNYWNPLKDENGKDVIWKNYYATRFADSTASAAYCMDKWNRLVNGSTRFSREIYSATLDPAMIDAAASTLAVFKSVTFLRLQNGELYGWEGAYEKYGSCEGSCQHVYNYVYSTCFLFPQLERSMRDIELKYGMHESGGTVFRVKLPLGREDRSYWFACLDGQMGIVFKFYREWKLSGDDAWLKKNWPVLKKTIAYAWSEENPHAWDRDKDGVLEGRCHHTLDMETFGPSGWLEGFYLAGLKAASEMAGYLGDLEAKKEYDALFENGREFTKRELFNGEYFVQKVDLRDKGVIDRLNASDYWNPEAGEIKYQIGEGCEIDQVAAQWHADLIGLGEIFDPDQRKKALESMMKYNYKTSFRDFANCWRVFALDDEAGTIICSYPENTKKPAIPIPYCEEVMTGMEYQFAGSLIAAGMWDDAVKVVRAVRDRYDGYKRNPFNEIECGNNYVRSMASYGLIALAAGFRFDLPHKKIGFDPRAPYPVFRAPWSVDGAWGNVIVDKRKGTVRINILGGKIDLSSLELPFAHPVTSVAIDGAATGFATDGGTISFGERTVKKSIVVTYSAE